MVTKVTTPGVSFSTRRLQALSTQHSALSTQHSALSSPPFSSNRPPSIEPEDLPGEVGSLGAQEEHGLCNLGRRAGAGQGDALEVLFALGLWEIVGPFHGAGGDGVYRYLRRQFAGQSQGQIEQSGLAGAIGQIRRQGALGEQIDHVDDVPTGLPKVGRETLCEQPWGFEMNRP